MIISLTFNPEANPIYEEKAESIFDACGIKEFTSIEESIEKMIFRAKTDDQYTVDSVCMLTDEANEEADNDSEIITFACEP